MGAARRGEGGRADRGRRRRGVQRVGAADGRPHCDREGDRGVCAHSRQLSGWEAPCERGSASYASHSPCLGSQSRVFPAVTVWGGVTVIVSTPTLHVQKAYFQWHAWSLSC